MEVAFGLAVTLKKILFMEFLLDLSKKCPSKVAQNYEELLNPRHLIVHDTHEENKQVIFSTYRTAEFG